jgi:protoheme IX farnesyltransferase
MKFRDDYAAAGVPMLPVVADDRRVTRDIVVYAVATVVASLVLIPVAPMGWVYSVGAVVLGAAFLWLCLRLRRAALRSSADVSAVAMRLFHGSITYLALLFLLVAVDPFLR